MGFWNISTFRSEKEQEQRTLRSSCHVQSAAKGWRQCFKPEGDVTCVSCCRGERQDSGKVASLDLARWVDISLCFFKFVYVCTPIEKLSNIVIIPPLNLFFFFFPDQKTKLDWIVGWQCGKFWKRWEYQTTWSASWETYMQVRKQQLELDREQQTGSK